MMEIRNNLSGKRFNKLTVIKPISRGKYERTKYLCLCDCGNEVVIEGSKIRNGHTKSCGCLRKEVDYGKGSRLPSGEASRNGLIHNYKSNSKVKGINFELTIEEMVLMFESDCYYCGREPHIATQKRGCNGAYIYNGIDRLDNDPKIGYTNKNTVPCCTKCNYMKNKLNHNEFIEWIDEVYHNLIKTRVITY